MSNTMCHPVNAHIWFSPLHRKYSYPKAICTTRANDNFIVFPLRSHTKSNYLSLFTGNALQEAILKIRLNTYFTGKSVSTLTRPPFKGDVRFSVSDFCLLLFIESLITSFQYVVRFFTLFFLQFIALRVIIQITYQKRLRRVLINLRISYR